MTYLSCVTICFSVFVSAEPDTLGYRLDSLDFLSGVFGLSPGVSGSCCQTHFFVWISCHMHLTLVLHSHAHPTIYRIRASMFLLRFMPIVDMSSQIWNSKFMAYLKGELLYASCLSLYNYQMSYMWVVIDHQKAGDWKWSRPLSGFWWIMTKHMYI